MGNGEKWCSYFSIMIVLLGSYLLLFTNNVSGEEPNILEGFFLGSIAIDQEYEVAHVAPGQDGIVTFTGTIYGRIPGGTLGNVNFLVEVKTDAGDWNVSDIPPVIFNKTRKEYDFEITINVPIGTPRSVNRTVNLTGTWRGMETNQTGNISGDTSPIIVKSYYILGVSSSGRLKVNAGSSVNGEFVIQNEGNGDDRIVLSIVNASQWVKRGWKIEGFEYKMQLPYQGICNYNISIKVPSDERSGIYKMEIIIISILDEVSIYITPEYEGIIEIEVENNLWNKIGLETQIVLISGVIFIMIFSVIIAFIIRKWRKNVG